MYWRPSAPVVGGNHEQAEQAAADWLQLPCCPAPNTCEHMFSCLLTTSRPVPVPHSLPQHDMVKVEKIMSEQNKTRPIGSN